MSKIVGQEDNKEILELAIKQDLPVLLIGETGTGKTSIIRELAKKQKKPLVRVNLNGQTGIDEFVGHWLVKKGATYWQDGVLIQAMKQGSWIVLDEVNACLPEILFVLHSLLDDEKSVMLSEKDGEIVKPAVGFRFFATMNPSEEYAGTKELNKAFMSRFPLILDFKYVDAKTESQLLQDRCGLDKATADKLVGFVQIIRAEKKKENIFYTFSTRDLIFWGDMYKLGLRRSFEITILNRAHNGDKDVLMKEFEKYFNQMFELEKKLGTDDFQKMLEKVAEQLAKQEKRKQLLEQMEQNIREQEETAKKELAQNKQEIEKNIKKMLEELDKKNQENKKQCEQSSKSNQSSNQETKEKKENGKKEKQSSQTGNGQPKPSTTGEIDVKQLMKSLEGKSKIEVEPMPYDEKEEVDALLKETKLNKKDLTSKPFVVQEPETCNHECDNCSAKEKCLEDVKGVK